MDHKSKSLNSYVTKERDKDASLKFLRKATKRYGNPEFVVSGKCLSYQAAMKVIGREGRQETGRHLNNRGESF
ncbi:DDE-type integrase/transposase/recombinase [Hyphomonas polymorpha]|uniref:DDE-type integrase/transposase/recombinase n=1 Tax=Hyphomonas polymorpha TaxID=74319 RepID=UPI000A01A9C9